MTPMLLMSIAFLVVLVACAQKRQRTADVPPTRPPAPEMPAVSQAQARAEDSLAGNEARAMPQPDTETPAMGQAHPSRNAFPPNGNALASQPLAAMTAAVRQANSSAASASAPALSALSQAAERQVTVNGEAPLQAPTQAMAAAPVASDGAAVPAAAAPDLVTLQEADAAPSGAPPLLAADEQGATNQLLYLAIAVLSLATLASTGTSLYLYRRRQQPVAGKDAPLPENLGKLLASLGTAVEQLGADQKQSLQTVSTATSENTEKTANMVNVFMGLRKALDEKDAEIKRLRGGYDAAVFKQFISRFARIDKAVNEYLEECRDKEALTALQQLLEDAFDECGVVKFSPEIGADYRKAEGVADHPRIERTEDASKDFKIAEVLEPGYKLVAGEESSVLVPAKVRIYKRAG